MRFAVCGVSLLAALTFSPLALADCADDIAMVEQDLDAAAAPAADEKPATAPKEQAGEAAATPEPAEAASGKTAENTAKSPEQVVDQMIAEGKSVEENGQETKFASGGLAEPRESWHSGNSLEEHPALVHLTSARERLEAGDEQGCLDNVGKARNEIAKE